MTQLAAERSARHSFLVVCADANGARFTLPLGSVVRFLEVSAKALVPHPENGKTGMYALQGEDGLLPLVHVSAATVDGLPAPSTAAPPSRPPARWPVLTYVHREQEVGIMVDQIVDVVDSAAPRHRSSEVDGRDSTHAVGDAAPALSVSAVAGQVCRAA